MQSQLKRNLLRLRMLRDNHKLKLHQPKQMPLPRLYLPKQHLLKRHLPMLHQLKQHLLKLHQLKQHLPKLHQLSLHPPNERITNILQAAN